MIIADANNHCQLFATAFVRYVQVHNATILLDSPNETNDKPTTANQHLQQPRLHAFISTREVPVAVWGILVWYHYLTKASYSKYIYYYLLHYCALMYYLGCL
jgi:hypothetical protein